MKLLWLFFFFFVSPAAAQERPLAYALTSDRVLAIDPETGAILDRIELGPGLGGDAIVGDGSRLFIIRRGDLKVVVVNTETKEIDTFFAECCLSGSAAVLQDRLYLVSQEFLNYVLTTYDARAGRGLRRVELPSDVRALTVLSPSTPSTPTPTAAAQCLGDDDKDGSVTVDELVRVVGNVLNGCPNE